MPLIIYVFLLVALAVAEVLYIRAARHWGLVDKPSERSLHTNTTTIRGGGVIFWLAALSVFVYTGFALPWFFMGLTLVAAISFIDDTRPVPFGYRMAIQAVGWSLALVQTGILPGQWGLLAVLILIGVGLLNTYNFMDGINGITAFYSLVTTGTLWYWFANVSMPEIGNVSVIETSRLFPVVFMALLVFSYFNARQRAVCFAGDVGSISMGFIIGYSLLGMVRAEQSLLLLLLLSVYGIDTVLTIGQRLWLKQNIFQPHRQHLFQLIVQKTKRSHLQVAGLYATIQFGVNCVVMKALGWSAISQWLLAGAILGGMVVIYGWVKWPLIKRKSWATGVA